jgi:hypothetical protein
MLFSALLLQGASAQTVGGTAGAPVRKMKRVLVIGETKGFEHDSISEAMVAVYNLGKQTGLWDATLRTDTELLTKDALKSNAKSVATFDAVVFAGTTGELDMTPAQKQDLITPGILFHVMSYAGSMAGSGHSDHVFGGDAVCLA